MAPKTKKTVGDPGSRDRLTLYRLYLRSLVFFVLPLLVALTPISLSQGDYFSFAGIVTTIFLTLMVYLAARGSRGSGHEYAIYRYGYGTLILCLGAFFLISIGVLGRYEYYPWTLVFIFLASIEFRPRNALIIILPYLGILLAATLKAAPRISLTGSDLVFHHLPAFGVLSVFIFLLHQINRRFHHGMVEAQKTLNQSKEQYRLISELVSDMSYSLRVDPEGRTEGIWFVGNLMGLCGYSEAEVRARGGWLTLVHPADSRIMEEHLRDLLLGQEGSITYRIIAKSGEARWLEEFSRPEWDQGRERVIRIHDALKDVTPRVEAEKALQVSRDRYSRLFSEAVIGIFEFTLENRDLRVNAAMAKIYGYESPEEMLEHYLASGKQFPTRPARGEDILGLVEEQGRIDNLELESVDRNGELIRVLLSANALRDEAGRMIGLAGFVQDISALKEAEAAQQSSYEALVTVFDSMDADIYVADLKTHRILFMNKHMKDSFGSLEGALCHKAFRHQDRPCSHCANGRLLDQEGRPTGLIVWDGVNPVTGRFYINYDRAVRWIDGEYAHLQVSTDATVRKEIEENLTRRVRELAALSSLGRKVNSVLPLKEVLQVSMREVKAALETDLITVFLVQGEELNLVAAENGPGGWEEEIHLHGIELCPCGQAARERRPIYARDFAAAPGCSAKRCLFEGMRSFAALPLVAGDEAMGVVAFGQREEVDYSERAEFLETMANEIAVGLHNSVLFDKLQAHASRLEETVRNLEAAQSALRDSERKFELFAENSPVMSFMKDASGRYLFASQGFGHYLGLDPKEMIGKTDRELWPEEQAAVFRESDLEVLRTGRDIEASHLLDDREGRRHSLLTYKFPVRAGEEAIVGGLSVDITERVEAEEAIRRSEAVSRALFGLIPDGILRFKRDGTITFYKPPSDGTVIVDPDPVGKNAAEFLSPEAFAERQTLVEEVLDRGVVASHEYVLEVNEVAYHREARYIRYGRDEIMAIIRDTTARKSLEEQLAQSQKMEAVGVLASGIAHDFNNILQAVSGHTQLLLSRDELSDALRERITRIDKTIQRAAEVVRRLLTFSRKGESVFEPLDLNQEIAHTVELLKHSLPKMIDIELDLAPELGLINGDSSQVEQVLMNLGVNAKDAMPDGGRLVFRTRPLKIGEDSPAYPDLEAGEFVTLQVIDTGQGMEPRVASRIFEPFFTTKKQGQGTRAGPFYRLRDRPGPPGTDKLPERARAGHHL